MNGLSAAGQHGEANDAGGRQDRRAPRTARDIEDAFGGRLLAWAGGLAVAIGVVLLLAVAVWRRWRWLGFAPWLIDVPGSLSRVASFVAFGLLLLGGAFAWERIRGDRVTAAR